jgi:diaminohydroxyphosphoribosylaminopyrimidine deaminase/5-amino-6-(5-phosphoribosylamino)uracil reductase
MTPDELLITRAFELAKMGSGSVSPNPLVGCVIIKDDKIIGEGWHRKYGESHAEVNALESVADKSLLVGSTVYVNLEPCSHFGKTPPCADALIKSAVKKVVISNHDPNPLVAGSGIKKLLEAGIQVTTGVLEKEGRDLNKRFFTFHEKKRPHVILKWAQTQDGFVARSNYESRWISNEFSRQLVHKWRSEEDAILVGTKTAFHDNPSLTVRAWSGKNPVRLVIDRSLRLDSTLQLFDKSTPTICFNLLKQEEQTNLKYIKLDEIDLVGQLVKYLYGTKIQSVLVEGGSQTLSLFVHANLWDEARIFTSTNTFQEGIEAPMLKGELISQQQLSTDLLSYFKPVT